MGHNCVLWLAVLTIFFGNVWSFALPVDFPEKQCTPGEGKQVDCNSCSCSPDGYWQCTRLGCGIRERRDTDEECTDDETKWDGNNYCVCSEKKWICHDVGGPCKPGETGMKDCNECFCSEKGLWRCTLVGCESDYLATRQERSAESVCTEDAVKYEGDKFCKCKDNKWDCQINEFALPCKPGERKAADCNGCWCQNGTWACTIMFCPPIPKIQDQEEVATHSSQAIRGKRNADEECTEMETKWEGKNYCVCHDKEWRCQDVGGPCKPGETKMEDCNHCFCTETGLWGCTLKGCSSYNLAIRGERSADEECTEMETKWEGNNYCACHDKKWRCHDVGGPCNPGETKMKDCNHCFCTETRLWICTLKGCLGIREERSADEECTDEETKWEGNNYCVCHDKKWRCQDVGGPCKHGETKMEDCNHCFCTETGLWGCTLMGCSKYNLAIREERSADEECTDEETKWEGNNYCVCHDKKWRCQDVGGPCKPGEMKMEDCNHCFCTETGLWGCTLMGCSKYNLAIREERSAETAAGSCELGQTKSSGCIKCWCNHNRTWECTMELCDEDVSDWCDIGKTRWVKNDTVLCFCIGGEWGCTEAETKAGSCTMELCDEGDPNVCTPGERKSMENDTVRCICMSGQWRCLKHETGQSCTGSKKKTAGCYTCWCSLQGTWECSMDLCVGDNLGGCRVDERRWLNNDTVQCLCWSGGWKCSEIVDGRCRTEGEYKREECNDCFCTDVELWACTRRKCVADYKGDDSCDKTGEARWSGPDYSEYCYCTSEYKWKCEDLGGPCRYNETKMEDCNLCKCNLHGLWDCEKNECTKEVVKREADDYCTNDRTKFDGNQYCKCVSHKWKCQEIGRPCPTDNKKWEVCNRANSCTCLDLGVRSCHRTKNCTHAVLKKQEEEETCSPLSPPKKKGCNYCFCTSRGLWVCTQNECGQLSKRSAEQFTCTPGQTFQKECNSCTCTKDGKNAVCTLKNCTLVEE